MVVFLGSLFDEFCDYLDGKLKWSKTKAKEWTDTVLKFFREKNKAESIPYVELKEYMRVDYIWRYDPARYSIHDIELAVEHEGEVRKVDNLVKEEVQHLIDLKARGKVGIFYPARGDEKELIEKTQQRIKAQDQKIILPYEKYLIILGYATTKKGKRAILFKGFFLNGKGDIEEERERVILQA